MSSIAVRNVDESIKAGLRLRSALHGWSMEQEVRAILQQALAPEFCGTSGFAERIRQRVAAQQTDDISTPTRQMARPPP